MIKELKMNYQELKEANNWNPEDGGLGEDWFTGGEPAKCELASEPVAGLFIFTAPNGASFAVRETDTSSDLVDSDWLWENGWAGDR